MTLLHRRADLRETMSDYLIRELERYGVAVRDRSEIAALHGAEGQLEAVTLKSGERLPFSFLFFFLGAQPCTEWLDDAVARAADGFILTGDAAGADNLLETSVPGIFAAGDVRSGSTKRCAAAVGEGSMAVQFVHAAPRSSQGSSRMSELCTHLDQVELRELPASVDGCEECLRDGGKWLHLRICLTCGHVGCCDDSPNRHATAHHHATSHPIIRSLEPGRGLELVLRRRGRIRPRRPSRHDAHPALAALELSARPCRAHARARDPTQRPSSAGGAPDRVPTANGPHEGARSTGSGEHRLSTKS